MWMYFYFFLIVTKCLKLLWFTLPVYEVIGANLRNTTKRSMVGTAWFFLDKSLAVNRIRKRWIKGNGVTTYLSTHPLRRGIADTKRAGNSNSVFFGILLF